MTSIDELAENQQNQANMLDAIASQLASLQRGQEILAMEARLGIGTPMRFGTFPGGADVAAAGSTDPGQTSVIANGAVTADSIAAGSITAEKIAAGAIRVGDTADTPSSLIPNGGFEDLDGAPADTQGVVIRGWEGGVARAWLAYSTAHYGGRYSLVSRHVSDTTEKDQRSDVIPVLPNRRFILKYWLRATAGNNAANACVVATETYSDREATVGGTNPTVRTVTLGASETWTQYADVGVTPASAAFLRVLVRHSAGGSVGDDVRVDDIEMYYADDDVNAAGGDVVIDSAGLTIRNGKINLIDDSGESVLGAAGFAGAWDDYVRNGLYNGAFRAPGSGSLSVGTVEASPGGVIPYWGWTLPTGCTATYDTDSVTVTVASSDVTVLRSSPVSIRSGGRYQVRLSTLSNSAIGGGTLISVTPKISWYTIELGYISTTAFDTHGTASELVTYEFTTEPKQAPNTAAYAVVEFHFTRTSGTGTGWFDCRQASMAEAPAENQQGTALLVDSLGANAYVWSPFVSGSNMKAGTATITGDGTAYKDLAVTFYEAAAVGPPVVVATVASLSSVFLVTVGSISSTGFTIRLFRRDGANFTSVVDVNWLSFDGLVP